MLKGLIDRGGITAVHWATDTQHPGREKFVSVGGDYVRTFLVLRGRRHVGVMRDGVFRSLILKAGECLVLGPHAKLALNYPESYLSIGFALQENYSRLVLSRYVYPRPVPFGVPPTRMTLVPGLCNDFVMSSTSALLAQEGHCSSELYTRRLMETLWLHVSRHQRQLPQERHTKAHFTFRAAEHFVTDHFAAPITRMDLAHHLHIHPSHVTRLFLRFAGESFGAFLLGMRLEAARRLLRDGRHTISETAFLSGFTSVNYFVRAYRRRYDITPGRDRRNLTTPL